MWFYCVLVFGKFHPSVTLCVCVCVCLSFCLCTCVCVFAYYVLSSFPQILSSLDIIIPMHLLLRIFKLGVERIQSDTEEAANLQAQPQPIPPPTAQQGGETVSPISPQKLPRVSDPYDLYDRETELVLPCFIMMLDILLKQVGNIKDYVCVGGWVSRWVGAYF